MMLPRDLISTTFVKTLVRLGLLVLALGVWGEKGWGFSCTPPSNPSTISTAQTTSASIGNFGFLTLTAGGSVDTSGDSNQGVAISSVSATACGISINGTTGQTVLKASKHIFEAFNDVSGTLTFNTGDCLLTNQYTGDSLIAIYVDSVSEGSTYTFSNSMQFTMPGGTFFQLGSRYSHPGTVINHGTTINHQGYDMTGYRIGGPGGDTTTVALTVTSNLDTGSGGVAITVPSGSPRINVTLTDPGAIRGSIGLGNNASSSIVHNSTAAITGNITMCGPAGGSACSGGGSQFLEIQNTGGVTGTITGGSILVDASKTFTTNGTINTGAITVNGTMNVSNSNSVTASGLSLGGAGQTACGPPQRWP